VLVVLHVHQGAAAWYLRRTLQGLSRTDGLNETLLIVEVTALRQ